MKKTSLVLLLVLVLAVGCRSAEPSPTSAPPQALELPATVQIKPTPTSVPPPPTPTPLPKPTATPVPEPTATLQAGVAPTATSEQPKPTEEPAPAVVDQMVAIPAGPFTMGSNDGAGDQSPAHEVDVAAFEIDQFEVTNADFAAFVQATGYQTDAEKAGSSSTWKKYATGKDNHPVVKVNWNDAQAFCAWLGKRLPTEAEWEKAARGIEQLAFPWGNDYDPNKANGKDRAIRSTTAVGSFPEGASPYGAMDMAGNVWEWTADWYKAYPGSQYTSDYFGEKFRVVRGGGWFETADLLRTTARNSNAETAANDDLGFRCAR